MRRLRFSIGNLLGLVLFLGCGFAALRAASDVADGAAFAATLGLMLIATLLAIHRTEAIRAYWLGFVLFGGTYLGVSLIPPLETRLPSTAGLRYLDSKVPGRQQVINYIVNVTGSPTGTANLTQLTMTTVNGTGLTVPGANLNIQPQMAYIWQGAGALRWLGSATGSTENFVRIGHCLSAVILAYLGGLYSRYLFQKGLSRREETQPARLTPEN